MAFGCQMDNAVDVFLLHQFVDSLEVANIQLYELVVGLTLDVFQISQVSGVCQLIQVNDLLFRIFVDEQTHYVTANESGTSGDDDISLGPISVRF